MEEDKKNTARPLEYDEQSKTYRVLRTETRVEEHGSDEPVVQQRIVQAITEQVGDQPPVTRVVESAGGGPDRRLLSPQWVYPLARLLFYGGVIAFFSHGQNAQNPMFSGIVCGILLADYITWIGISLIELPSRVREFTVESVINLATTLVLFKMVGIDIPRDEERMAMAFLAFILFAIVKAFIYIFEYFFREE